MAAYNAGPAAVERWQKALPQADVDEWVEHITFEETRDYVKKVLGSYNAYKLLYTTQSPLLQITPRAPAKGPTWRRVTRRSPSLHLLGGGRGRRNSSCFRGVHVCTVPDPMKPEKEEGAFAGARRIPWAGPRGLDAVLQGWRADRAALAQLRAR